jgi:hypothetical protein
VDAKCENQVHAVSCDPNDMNSSSGVDNHRNYHTQHHAGCSFTGYLYYAMVRDSITITSATFETCPSFGQD